jgi:RND family efflux transporter MFP subunit
MPDQPVSSPSSAASLSRLAIDRSAGPAVRRRRPLWRRWWIWLLVLAAVAVAALVVRGRQAAMSVDMATVASAYPSTSVALLNATGRVVAARRASVSSKGTGRLEWLGVQEGQMVKEGDVIARLENRDVAAQREQAQAQVQAARANLAQGQAELDDAQAALKRAQDLAKQNFISGSALDTAGARHNKARAAIDTLKAQIAVAEANARVAGVAYDQTLIRAPFTGIVLTKSANVGDIVTPFSSASGTTGAVVTMADMETLEVEADVSESSIAKIRVGQPAEIQLDAFPDLRLLGEVSRIVPTVDRSKATLLVKVAFVERDGRVLPDMSAKIAFLTRALTAAERQPVPAVRPDAIVRRDGREVVFVVTRDEQGGGERVKSQPVTVGAKVGDLVRVDLAPGTRVVSAPTERLADGAAVTAAKK